MAENLLDGGAAGEESRGVGGWESIPGSGRAGQEQGSCEGRCWARQEEVEA